MMSTVKCSCLLQQLARKASVLIWQTFKATCRPVQEWHAIARANLLIYLPYVLLMAYNLAQ